MYEQNLHLPPYSLTGIFSWHFCMDIILLEVSINTGCANFWR